MAAKTKVLFVRNLNYDTTKESVKDKFVDCTDVRILTFSDTGRSKGLGFIEFDTMEDAERAYDEMQGCTIDDRQITLDYAEERNPGGPGKSKVLFVRNLNYDTTTDTIKDKFPDASDVRILSYPDGRSKGTGFIEFTNPEDAQRALEDYQGETIDDRVISLDYAQERRSGGRGPGGMRRGGRGGSSYYGGGGGGRDYGERRDYGGRRDYGSGGGGGGRDYRSGGRSSGGGYGGYSSYSRGGGGRRSESGNWRDEGGRSSGWSDYDYGN